MATEKTIITAASLVEASKAPEFVQLLGVLATRVAVEMASVSTDSNQKAALMRYASNAMSNASYFSLSAISSQKVSDEIVSLGYDADINKYVVTKDFVSQIVVMNSPF